MRSGIHGTFATLLLIIPVLSIPALAIFGIPQFAPVVASPLDEGSYRDRERRVGQSERPAVDGLVGETDDDSSDEDKYYRSRNDSRPPGKLGDSVPIPGMSRNAPAWNADELDAKNLSQAPPRSDAWADDVSNEIRRDGKPAAANPLVDRGGIDPRFANASFESKRSASPSALREQRSDLIPVASTAVSERPISQSRSRERETASSRTIASGPAASDRELLTWQGALNRLNERKIHNFRVERGHRENLFVCICSYTPSDTPRVSYRFEAEADEPLKAVEKVLEQIDEWRQRR